jgi:ectoine hydroxylase-related dioxygenase (phytanoyl-CoA dioxygenase family)
MNNDESELPMSTTYSPSSTLPSSVDLPEMKASFQQHGYAVARGLFSDAEVEEIKSTFSRIAENGPIPGHFDQLSKEESAGDPLKEFPRVMHPHRFDAVSRKHLVHPGVLTCLRELMQDDVLAAQSMFYYKPPGSRGQAMHQDNFYLLVEPQTCVAAWTAIDDADPENGGMYLVADTADEEITCPETANATESFTPHFVPTPKGKKAVPCKMKAGDTLFFNGNSIHGSGPNRSKERFRRSFICHYVPKSTQRISKFYLPLLTPEGQNVMIEANTGGGACGGSWEGGTH